MTTLSRLNRWGIGALTAGLAYALVGGLTLSAHAAEAAPVDVQISTDGIHFSSNLTGSLFQGSGALIPGGSAVSTLWIKNPTASPASMRVSVTGVDVSTAAHAEVMSLSVWDSGSGTTSTGDLSGLGSCDVVVPVQEVAAGAVVKVIATLSLDPAVTGTDGQGEDASIGLLVAMRDAEVGAFPKSACKDDGVLIPPTPTPTATPKPSAEPTPAPTSVGAATPGKKDLAETGFEANGPILFAGALLLGGGVFLAVRRRRQGDNRS